MILKRLGSTSLQVSPIGLGLAALGRPAYISIGHNRDLGTDTSPAQLERRAHNVLDTAWMLGVRYVDVARSYGLGEKFLANWLNSRWRADDPVMVASKWGYTYVADWDIEVSQHEIKDHSLATLTRQWEETQALLGQRVRIYQAHSATVDSPLWTDNEVLTQLHSLKQQGVVIGLTTSGPQQAQSIGYALELKMDGVRLFDTVQATWNLLEPSAASALSEARAAGMGVILKEVLANGRLSERNTLKDLSSNYPLLQSQATRLGTSGAVLAFAAALARPWRDVVLSGAATIDQLESNIAALTIWWDAEAASKLNALAEPPEVYWAKRSQLVWN